MKKLLHKIKECFSSQLVKDYFENAFRWKKGRQDGGYDKMLLLYSILPIKFDVYLIRYRVGSYIPPHTDNVVSGKHYRLNIVLKKCEEGGEFLCDHCLINTPRIKLFRPDLHTHSVNEVKKGHRYIFSLGWIK